MVRDGLFIFNSVHRVMKAEKVLKSGSVNARVMPVPRQLSSDCGLALAFPLAERETAEILLHSAGIVPEETWKLEEGGGYVRI
ncbi:DUF3343 domain-containing protein [bacterium]|nr:MAG: DUF3343 domain-containing protein [bacterium]